MVAKSSVSEKVRISNMYFEAIGELGLNPEIDGDGDVVFDGLSSKGYKLIAIIDEDHEEFIRIALPGLASVKDLDRVKILEACNYVNMKNKCTKVYIEGSSDYVWAAYEIIVRTLSKDIILEMISVSRAVLESCSVKFASYLSDNK